MISAIKIGIVALFILSNSATAGLITFTDKVNFDAAVSNQIVEDFEGIVPSGSTLYNSNYSSGWSFGGDVTYRSLADGYTTTSTSNYMAVLGGAFYAPYYERGTGTEIHATSDQWLRMDINGGSTAIAGLWSTIFRGGDTLNVRFSTGDSTSFFVGQDPWQFQGWVLDTAADWVEVRAPSDYMMLDNFTYATATSVPEPQSIALLALGFLGLMARRSKK